MFKYILVSVFTAVALIVTAMYFIHSWMIMDCKIIMNQEHVDPEIIESVCK